MKNFDCVSDEWYPGNEATNHFWFHWFRVLAHRKANT
jgi:hypothetical protein